MKISIITATYNCAQTLGDCLSSVASQAYANREHVVIDGASQDGTLDVLQASRSQLAVLLSEPDRGIYDALNKGIAHASGDVIGFLHADDVYASPDVLAHVAQAFADPAVCAVYGDLQYVRKDDMSQVVRVWQSAVFTTQRLTWGSDSWLNRLQSGRHSPDLWRASLNGVDLIDSYFLVNDELCYLPAQQAPSH
ncbi:MAG: hypothetical protein CFE38_08240 [Comamonadaceae bacterium PBBC1]|nr:MAG: hypothetical protein CFE38_08240 [Comamonadaceae bacterium PBBC1]